MGLGLSGLRLGLGQRGGGGVPALPNFYVDSVGGSDANDGLTDATAFQTLGAAETAIGTFGAGAWASLALGSEWAEQLDLAVANAKMTTHGTGAIPYIDAAGAVTETWYQPDSGTYPNVWAIDVTHGFTTAQGQSRLPMWEDGALMTRVTSLATLNSTAGASYSPNDENLTPATVTVYIHATGSGNPNSNGRTYEIARRQYGINGAYAGAGMSLTGPLKSGRQSSNDGAITLGKNSLIDRVVVIDGHKHNALQESGVCRDSAFIGAQPVNGYLHVFYTPDATGDTAEYTRCFFEGNDGDTAATASILGVYCHDNSGGAHATFDLEQVAFTGIAGPVNSAATAATMTGCYFNFCDSIGDIGSTTIDLNLAMIRDTGKAVVKSSPTTSGTAMTLRNSAIYVAGSNTLQNYPLIRNQTPTGITMTIQNNTVYASAEKLPIFRDIGTGANSYTIRDNIVVTNGTFGFIVLEISPNVVAADIDYNIYWYAGTKAQLKFDAAGTALTPAQWQALGYDANSLFIDATDITADALFLNGLAGVAAGDFRLATDTGLTFGDGTPIHERAGPQSHWDWNALASAAGAPTAWPNVPVGVANAETYIADPAAWTF